MRYPEDIFKVQRQIFAKYHVTDPTGFFSGQDFWTVPNDPTRPTASTAQPPYYLQVQMPAQTRAGVLADDDVRAAASATPSRRSWR